jgi:protoheme IX farnesyltransferase
LLYLFSGWLALLLGLTSFIWYNIIYTNLKRITPFAVIPGSIIGAIPPLVGWVAAGGSLAESNALILALFFFIWQIPHFWMLALHYASDYKKAGFPVLTDLYSATQIRKQLFGLIFISAVVAGFMALSGLVSSMVISILILILSAVLTIQFGILLNENQQLKLNIHFRSINYYVLTVVILLCIDHLI